ncbi:MAG TPA: O-antigen ligase family protein [Candidatus Sulfotelmatobacter sp.]|nr:O-antigen ligase family protein [Candidatus Sulfotelmatobacter sp.]
MVFTRKNLDWWCERGMVFLFLAMLVFAPLAFGAAELWAQLVLEAMAAGVFILWGVRLWLKANRRPKILWPPLAWPVMAFTVYAIYRYFTADIEYVARIEVLQVILFALLFFVVLNNLRGQEETELVAWTLITVATVIACLAVAQFVTHSDRVWNVYSGAMTRGTGTYISPNHLAGFLEMILPLALAFLLAGKIKIVPRILLGYAVVALLGGLTVTFSRAGWVSAAAGIFLTLGILLGHKNHRLPAAILLAVLLLGGTVFVNHYLAKTATFEQRVKPSDPGTGANYDWDTRRLMWGAAERMWLDNFWLGTGPAHFDYRFREYRPTEFQGRPDRCHNDYLNLLADWGAVGGIIVIGGMGIFVFGLIKTWPHVRRAENDFGSGQSNRFAFFVGAIGGLGALAVHSLMDFNLHIPANALVAVTLLALLASQLRFATDNYWLQVFTRERILLTGVLALTAAVFFWQGWRGGRESFWLARAGRQHIFSLEGAALLEKAFAAEPKNFQTADDIGECYRIQSLDGGNDYRQLAQTANGWFARAAALDRHDPQSRMRSGLCLDWLDDHVAAEKMLYEAGALDANSYYFVNTLGWHYVQTGDYPAARECFIRSLSLFGDNATARNYLQICDEKLVERASGRPVLPSGY